MAKKHKKQGNKLIIEEEVAQNSSESISYLNARISFIDYEIAALESERAELQDLVDDF